MKTACLALLMSIITANLWANTTTPTATPKAQELIQKALDQSQEFNDVTSTVEMTTVESNGREHSRTLQIKVLKRDNGDILKSLIVFVEPARERGVALLSHLYTDESRTDQQWLYLPNLRKTKPIIGSGRQGAFMGSEFSYSDLVPQSAQEYDYSEVKTDSLDNRPHWVIEATPKATDSPYSKQIVWLDQKTLIATRTEFYDTNGKRWKLLTAEDMTVDNEGRERPSRLVMANLLNQRKTILQDREYRTNTGLKDSAFEEIELPFALQ